MHEAVEGLSFRGTEQLHHDAAKLQPLLAGANEGLGRLHGRGELSARMVFRV